MTNPNPQPNGSLSTLSGRKPRLVTSNRDHHFILTRRSYVRLASKIAQTKAHAT